MVSSGDKFESDLKDLAKSKKWTVEQIDKNNANLEEIFLKLTTEEE
jgi:uncharacterized membrane protein YcaP (DUF421 family)